MYTSLEHYIDGNWVKPTGSKKQDVVNPANSKPIGELGHVSKGDLDKALAAADKGFKTWRRVSSFERGKVLRKAGDLLRSRADEIAKVLDLSPNTAASRYRYGLDKLRQQLRPLYDEIK